MKTLFFFCSVFEVWRSKITICDGQNILLLSVIPSYLNNHITMGVGRKQSKKRARKNGVSNANNF